MILKQYYLGCLAHASYMIADEETKTAVVVDPQYSAPFNNPSRLWVGPGQLARYFPLTSLSRVLLAVRLETPEGWEELWNEF